MDFSTFLGGSGDDYGRGIFVDSGGNSYITGKTLSSTFPTTPGANNTNYNNLNDVFITKVDSKGSKLVYSTFIGGSNNEEAWDIVCDNEGNAFITGYTYSSDFPKTINAYDDILNGTIDIFVCKLNSNCSILKYSTYFGGNSNDFGYAIIIDSSGNAYITGRTESSDLPTTNI